LLGFTLKEHPTQNCDPGRTSYTPQGTLCWVDDV